MLLFQSLCWRNCRPELFWAAVPMLSTHPPCPLLWFRTQLQCKDTFLEGGSKSYANLIWNRFGSLSSSHLKQLSKLAFHKLPIVICKTYLWCCWLILAWAPQAASIQCWTGKHSTVWDSCCLKLLLFQDLQMPVSIMLQSRHSDKEAVFQYEKQFLMNYLKCQFFGKWMFGCICRWHPWVSLKASSQCLWPLLSRVMMFLGWWHHRALKYM